MEGWSNVWDFAEDISKLIFLNESCGVNVTLRTRKLLFFAFSGPILGLCPANERRRYKAPASLIGWTQT